MVAWWCSKANRIWLRILALVVSSVFFFTQVVGASVPDRSFWAERRRARQKLLASREKPHQSDSRKGLGEKIEEKDVAVEVSSLITSQSLLTIPSEYGTVKEVHTEGTREKREGMGNRLIIHIQDAHSSPEAQLNSANILRYISDNVSQAFGSIESGAGAPARGSSNGVSSESLTRQGETIVSHSKPNGETIVSHSMPNPKQSLPLLICVEGSSGLIDTTLLSSFPEKKVKEEVAGEFLEEGKITGEEYFAIVQSDGGEARRDKAPAVTIYGVEDKRTYEKNLRAFEESLSSGEKVRNYLQEVEKEINRLKARLYNKKLKELESKIEAYQKKKISLSQYCQYLNHLLDGNVAAERSSAETSKAHALLLQAKYPNFKLFVRHLNLRRR